MFQEDEARLGLAEYLAGLQAELSKARVQAERHGLQFSADGFTLEVDISYTLARSADSQPTAKPEFWVLGADAQEAKDGALFPRRAMQHLIVRLSPRSQAMDADTSQDVPPSTLPPARLPNAG